MRKARRSMAVVAVLVAALGAVTLAAEEKTLTGTYHWTGNGEKGDLKAVFTPAGEETWDVSFYFKFDGQSHVYSGTATGSFANGKLAGKVKNEGKNRTYSFTGSFKDGTFRGTHAEVTGSGEQRTGTLTLKS